MGVVCVWHQFPIVGVRLNARTMSAPSSSIGPNAIGDLRVARPAIISPIADERAEQEAAEDAVVDGGPADVAEVEPEHTAEPDVAPSERPGRDEHQHEQHRVRRGAALDGAQVVVPFVAYPGGEREQDDRRAGCRVHEPVRQPVVLVVDEDQRRPGARERDECRQQRRPARRGSGESSEDNGGERCEPATAPAGLRAAVPGLVFRSGTVRVSRARYGVMARQSAADTAAPAASFVTAMRPPLPGRSGRASLCRRAYGSVRWMCASR